MLILGRQLSKSRFAVIVLAVVALMAFAGSFFVPVYQTVCHHFQYSGTKYCATYQVAVAVFFQGAHFLESHNGAITALSTVLLTIVTGLLSWLAWDQGHTSRAQLRAYVSVEGLTVKHSGQSLRLEIDLFNSGETPAFRPIITLRTVFVPAKADLPPTFKKPPTTLNGVTIRRSGKSTTFHEAEMPTTTWNGFERGSTYMWVIGTVIYFDVFGRKRTTDFKAHAEGLADLMQQGFFFSDDGNEAT